MWSIAACFALAAISAVVPWVNAELMLVAFAVPATSTSGLALLVLAATAGQVAGKAGLYWAARRAPTARSPRLISSVERWRHRFEDRPSAAMSMMLLSAIFGLPPFYLTTLVAGTLRIGFSRFLMAAAVGRVLHFGAVALVPQVAGQVLR